MQCSKSIEASDFNTNRIELQPRLLLCLNCKRGGGDVGCSQIDELADEIKVNPDIHITMRGAFDEIGARTEFFDKQTPAQRRSDLHVLQKLGLCFGDTRTARDLLYRISRNIDSIQGICTASNPYRVLDECPLALKGYFIEGNKPLPPVQSPETMKEYKIYSCKALEQTDHVVIRAHHLLCIVCYAGRDDNTTPPAEDNLLEAWVKFRENPDIPVTVVEGTRYCCICPPCHSYNQKRGICVAACHLRDRRKDLDLCFAIGIMPGETYTARELYMRIHAQITNIGMICGYEIVTIPEWDSCGGVVSGAFERGLDACRIQ